MWIHKFIFIILYIFSYFCYIAYFPSLFIYLHTRMYVCMYVWAWNVSLSLKSIYTLSLQLLLLGFPKTFIMILKSLFMCTLFSLFFRFYFHFYFFFCSSRQLNHSLNNVTQVFCKTLNHQRFVSIKYNASNNLLFAGIILYIAGIIYKHTPSIY